MRQRCLWLMTRRRDEGDGAYDVSGKRGETAELALGCRVPRSQEVVQLQVLAQPWTSRVLAPRVGHGQPLAGEPPAMEGSRGKAVLFFCPSHDFFFFLPSQSPL